MIDFWCSLPHYAEHLRPLWDALPAEARGKWVDETDTPAGGDVVVVAAYRDLRWVTIRYRATALVEHGIGQTYGYAHPAYPGGLRDGYDLLLAPGAHVIDPAARETVLVGCPGEPGSGPTTPVTPPSRFAVSFHWDCGVAPEAGTAAWEFLPWLQQQAELLPEGLLVHAHPRIQFDVFERIIDLPDLEPCPSFAKVRERACVYACDNSSTLFEFAALDRPVVVLNSERYRRSAEYGKRFWSWADVGEQISDPSQLAAAMHRAHASDPAAARRREIVAACYQGNTADGAAALLRLCRDRGGCR